MIKPKVLINKIKSMKLGLLLLMLLASISVIGSFIPQGRDMAFYESMFSKEGALWIERLKLYDIYHGWVFIFLFAGLCINLFLCSVTRINGIIKKVKELPSIEKMIKVETYQASTELDEKQILSAFRRYGFNKYYKSKYNEGYYSRRNVLGYFGSWLIHMGLLFIIVAYGYGQFTSYSTAVYGIAGDVIEVGNTQYKIAINDFQVIHREDGSISQYITEADLMDLEGNLLKSSEIYVNKPLRYDRYNFYQTASGWTVGISYIRDEVLQYDDILYEGTALINENDNIAIMFSKFYPDFLETDKGFFNNSPMLNNPKILYSIFYRENRVAMNFVDPGEMITWNNYKFIFDNPNQYTYLQVNRIKGKSIISIGSSLIIIGLILVFYLKPQVLVIDKSYNEVNIYRY
ncbi:cytochrome c biogenesis protein ResB [Alkaliphilus peptidifermentans]|uniref:Cytochrome c biogenesis protein n=1 Tax=Alkaliphilus peptidifermentans DSM 18978 TaxID=1120976 RepID=A0A1G5BJP4_9FIRM|nr:cytochrome c biogenesis protein ResB [Alkaliphilus peptidifermentans]SCX90381.1 cytochrome c biogenesis protein [Alkaliphilus peptidifermentans DSM 18978]